MQEDFLRFAYPTKACWLLIVVESIKTNVAFLAFQVQCKALSTKCKFYLVFRNLVANHTRLTYGGNSGNWHLTLYSIDFKINMWSWNCHSAILMPWADCLIRSSLLLFILIAICKGIVPRTSDEFPKVPGRRHCKFNLVLNYTKSVIASICTLGFIINM